MSKEEDERLALLLQEEYYSELIGNDSKVNEEVSSLLPKVTKSPPSKDSKFSVVAPEWEDLDPTPDLHALFLQFNQQFFWNRLNGCEVKWPPRMTLCAGVCR